MSRSIRVKMGGLSVPPLLSTRKRKRGRLFGPSAIRGNFSAPLVAK